MSTSLNERNSAGYQATLYQGATLASLVLSACFALLGPGRTGWLLYRRHPVSAPTLTFPKVAFHSLHTALQIALAVLWASSHGGSIYSILAASLAAGCGAVAQFLSYLENVRNPRPSFLLGAYFMLLAIFSVTRTSTIWTLSADTNVNVLLTVVTVVEAVLIILESIEKPAPGISKDEQPESYSGLANRLVFLWPSRLFVLGARNLLNPEQLFALDEDMASATLYERFSFKFAQRRDGSRHRSFRTLLAILWKPFVRAVIPRLAMVGLNVSQPLLTSCLLQYLGSASTRSLSEGRALIGAYALQYVGLAAFTGVFWQYHVRFLTMIRGCLVSAINEKILRADLSSLPDPKSTLTLMSTDMQQINLGFMRMHDLWANTLQAGTAAYLLSRQVGVAAVYPVIIVVCSAIGSITISPWTSKRQKGWMKAVETRVGVTSSMLSSIRGLKMRGLLPTASDRVQNLRRAELRKANLFRNTMVYSFILAYIPQYIGPVVAFLAFILQARARGEEFDAPRAFTSLSTLLILNQPLASTIQVVPLFVAALGSCARMDKFLATPDHVDIREFPSHSNSELSEKSSPTPTRADLDSKGEKQTPDPQSGEKHPNLFNIVDADLGWTKEAAVLHSINTTIPTGHLTCIVGPVACGKTALCRALLGEGVLHGGRIQCFGRPNDIAYVDQLPWLINDTIQRNIIGFSGVDKTWYDQVIEACALRRDIDELPAGSDTLVGNEGAALSGGQKQRVCLARALYSRKSTIIIDDGLSGLDARTERHVFRHAIGPSGLAAQYGATTIFAVHSTPHLSQARHVIMLGPGGRITRQGSYSSLDEISIEQSLHSDDVDDSCNQSPEPDTQHTPPEHASDRSETTETTAKQDRQKIMTDKSAYAYYFKSAGLFFMFLLFGFMAVQTGLNVTATWWLGFWTETDRPDSMRYWAVYCSMQFLALILLSFVVYGIIVVMVTRTGTSMHYNLIRTVRSAFLPFLSTRDSGKTLNHFSQDIEIMDRDLPFSFADVLIAITTFTGQALLILAIFPWSGFILLVCGVVVYFLQRVYLRTSRQMRLLDLEAKSPLYSNYQSILLGASTIRAYGWIRPNFDHVQVLLDKSQQPFYLLQIIQQWLNFVLEMLVACIAIVVVIIAVTVQALPSSTGVVLTQVMSIALWLQYAVKGWTLFETSLGAIGRIKQFEEQTPLESRSNSQDPPPNWPMEGRIEWRNVTSSYGLLTEQNALKDLSVTILPGQWVGICGTTGSGKSSFLQTLLQLLDIKQGRIAIDNVCLDELEPDAVRQRINTIPQDHTSIPGTVRFNLDPHQAHSDEEITDALEKVSLHHLLATELELSKEFDPSKLSAGQRQLFAMAMAILNKSKVVLVDEATSQLDLEAEALIQKILRTEFQSSTVLAIAHRLKSFSDYDRILVLEEGRVVEFDTPEALLQRDSYYRQMLSIHP